MPHLYARMRRLTSHETKAPVDDEYRFPNFYRMTIPDARSDSGVRTSSASASDQNNVAMSSTTSTTIDDGSNSSGGKMWNIQSKLYIPRIPREQTMSATNFASTQGNHQETHAAILNKSGGGAQNREQCGQPDSNFDRQAYAAYTNLFHPPDRQQNRQQSMPCFRSAFPTTQHLPNAPEHQQTQNINQAMINGFFMHMANQHQSYPSSNNAMINHSMPLSNATCNSQLQTYRTQPSNEVASPLPYAMHTQELQNSISLPAAPSGTSHSLNSTAPNMRNNQHIGIYQYNHINTPPQLPPSQGGDHTEGTNATFNDFRE